ncbi:hypothetical protein JIN77_16730 [Verrucomicrobiaceae bacterium R5-34]|uniref:Nucleotide-diphospho-sugar transferase domain-containing protein n=1 Tax=Oceaniferula flava TaxID=2800421 RepID=A0AAE2VDB5_9BACT|nr:hypothetical protein [Oceaniferula flavus]MBK1832386.1 hypothetical protein [Verrucomicrobiaceae bacterium R5-34]MBK1856560.1 hypothetical protein [Oceaniferula flavus]MBM1137867.1 hypothetical protein [Oceaniferula flavus]
MFSADEGDNSNHPQVGTNIGAQRVKNHYWRSAVCLYASAHAHHPEARKILLVNKMPPETIDGYDYRSLLDRFNVELVEFDSITRPPEGYHTGWNTQFIVIDALETLWRKVSPTSQVMLLDSDCLFVKPVDQEIIDRVKKLGVLQYTLWDADDISENGLTNYELAELGREYSDQVTTDVIKYAGGEIFFGDYKALESVIKEARRAYDISIKRNSKGLKKFNEEAHLLSYVYHLVGGKDYSANDLIKRIWTDRSLYCTVNGEENNLTIWHLPAEKKTSLRKMYQILGRGGDYFTDIEKCSVFFNVTATKLSLFKMYLRNQARRLVKVYRKLKS